MNKYEKLNLIGEGAHARVFKMRVRKRSELEKELNKGFETEEQKEEGVSKEKNHNWNKFRTKKRKFESMFDLTSGINFNDLPEEVAMKKIMMINNQEGLRMEAIREIKSLQELNHENVIKVYDILYHNGNVRLIMELLEFDLQQVIYSNLVLKKSQIKTYMKLILEGIMNCHDAWIIHRDLKPGNILLAKGGKLKIADFGLSRMFGSPNRVLSKEACTLWYRAPELLFGAPSYGPASDMWSIGCIFGELIRRKALFRGRNQIEQIQKIVSIIGAPNELSWPGVTALEDFMMFEEKGVTLSEFMKGCYPDEIDLLSKFLEWDPRKRISALDALKHPYFSNPPEGVPPSDLPILKKK